MLGRENRIYVEIEDGRRGIFDVKPYLDRGVFRELRDQHDFHQGGIQFGVVTWPHEQDIAPETLLEETAPVDYALAADAAVAEEHIPPQQEDV